MRIRSGENRVETVHGLKGGAGSVELHHFFEQEDFRGTGRMFARFVLAPGNSIGYHKHIGDFEAYYILKGQGRYNDNGEVYEVGPGDFLLCREGESHSIENTGDGDMEYIGLILYVKD